MTGECPRNRAHVARWRVRRHNHYTVLHLPNHSFVNTALRMRELDADCGSGETNLSLRKQMLQEDAWHIVQRTRNEQLCMETGPYPRRTSSVACYHGSAKSAVKNHTTGIADDRRRGRPRKSWRDDIEELTGQSLSWLLLTTGGRSGWVKIALQSCVGVPPNNAWTSQELVS